MGGGFARVACGLIALALLASCAPPPSPHFRIVPHREGLSVGVGELFLDGQPLAREALLTALSERSSRQQELALEADPQLTIETLNWVLLQAARAQTKLVHLQIENTRTSFRLRPSAQALSWLVVQASDSGWKLAVLSSTPPASEQSYEFRPAERESALAAQRWLIEACRRCGSVLMVVAPNTAAREGFAP
jgi:hypothetical protein